MNSEKNASFLRLACCLVLLFFSAVGHAQIHPAKRFARWSSVMNRLEKSIGDCRAMLAEIRQSPPAKGGFSPEFLAAMQVLLQRRRQAEVLKSNRFPATHEAIATKVNASFADLLDLMREVQAEWAQAQKTAGDLRRTIGVPRAGTLKNQFPLSGAAIEVSPTTGLGKISTADPRFNKYLKP